MTFSTPLLTNYSSKGYSKGEARAITPQGARTTTLNLSPNIFNNKVAPIEINQELKNINKLKEDSFRNATSKHLLAFINALENTNKPVVLYRLIPLLILKKGTASEEQTINSYVL